MSLEGGGETGDHIGQGERREREGEGRLRTNVEDFTVITIVLLLSVEDSCSNIPILNFDQMLLQTVDESVNLRNLVLPVTLHTLL